jgi:poly(3-hydroxybutyrate) depolymerase
MSQGEEASPTWVTSTPQVLSNSIVMRNANGSFSANEFSATRIVASTLIQAETTLEASSVFVMKNYGTADPNENTPGAGTAGAVYFKILE